MPNAPKWVFDIAERLISKLPTIEVSHVEFLSSSIKKIRLKGDFSNTTFQVGSYLDFRVSDTEVRRYTVSYVDIEYSYIELIVYLHGKGSGSHYMNSLEVGDKLSITHPQAYKYFDKTAEKIFVVGDETSL